ncbi:MAG: efflux RND transporter periplasmic adaptor subunit [Opitutaceae bacterium]|nr:efflux RND transporter periplasmic adaptor subunit [Opitutaceae bacterium]
MADLQSKPRRRTPLLIGVVLTLAAAGAAAWYLPRTKAAAAAPAYRLATVARGSIVQTVTATGTLSPLTTVSVGSQVSGTIAKLHVDFNDTVRSGQLLAEIEPSTYAARVVQAEADLDSARATLELKRLNAKRSGELAAAKLVSQADLDAVTAELRQQEATVRIKEGSLASARVDLERTKIHSPIDGVVIARKVDVGQTVQASFSAPELFTLAEDLRRMQISASVSEADIGGVRAGQPVEFTVDAYPNDRFEGAVRQVRANATTTSNVVTYPTIITVENGDQRLLPGMTASVTITTADRRDILRVPNAAIRFAPPAGAAIASAGGPPPDALVPPEAGTTSTQSISVFTLAAGEAAAAGSGALVPRLVQIGVTDGAYTEVLSGLDEGARVVTGILTADTIAAAASDGQTRNPFMPTPPRAASPTNSKASSSAGGPPPPPM